MILYDNQAPTSEVVEDIIELKKWRNEDSIGKNWKAHS